MEDKQLLALHEAGHAVAHKRLGIDIDHVTIAPGRGSAGHVTGDGNKHVWKKIEAEAMAIAWCAGYAALVAAGVADSVAREGCEDDFDKTIELDERWRLSGLGECQRRAIHLMREPKNTAAVALVAQHLLEHTTLEMDFLDVLVDLSDGQCTQEEFEQFLRLRASARSHSPTTPGAAERRARTMDDHTTASPMEPERVALLARISRQIAAAQRLQDWQVKLKAGTFNDDDAAGLQRDIDTDF